MSDTEDMLDGEQLKTIVENQLAEGNPIEVKENLMRLVMTGTNREEAIDMMACALGLEMEKMVSTGKPFNTKQYLAKIEQLPETPWLDTFI
ncbi:hypothetical protein [Sansalvadorimonas verongulae]|uniref:hypothetical protein n=1 Tax=Sansalvadorimonas verongulae TaxID=2172824 RepID=UPI0012BCB71E|nr:hypothetical protein [Sansalvadorimonas verongulae]MTI13980.1 hypothetical protein [Sansalvadorimonas verongulae]